MKPDRFVAPWMRTAITNGKALDQKYGKTLYSVWLIVLAASIVAIVMTNHHETDMTAQVDRAEVVSRWDRSQEDMGAAMSRELWIMKEAVDSGRHIDALYQMRH